MFACKKFLQVSVSISVSTRACHCIDRAKAGFDSPTESEMFLLCYLLHFLIAMPAPDIVYILLAFGHLPDYEDHFTALFVSYSYSNC